MAGGQERSRASGQAEGNLPHEPRTALLRAEPAPVCLPVQHMHLETCEGTNSRVLAGAGRVSSVPTCGLQPASPACEPVLNPQTTSDRGDRFDLQAQLHCFSIPTPALRPGLHAEGDSVRTRMPARTRPAHEAGGSPAEPPGKKRACPFTWDSELLAVELARKLVSRLPNTSWRGGVLIKGSCGA